MAHQQPTPENHPADNSNNFYLERLPPSPDSATAAELAHAIVSDGAETYTSPDNGMTWLRDTWDSDNGVLTFHLFESHQNNDYHYTLDINDAGVFSSYSYAFSRSDPVPVLNEGRSDASEDEVTLLPDQVTAQLRARYSKTQHYAQNREAYNRSFTETMARAAAEYVLGHKAEFGSGATLAKELEASDPVVRERARTRLFKIAQLGGLIEDQALFDIALQVTVYERKETSAVAGIDEIIQARQQETPRRIFRFKRR